MSEPAVDPNDELDGEHEPEPFEPPTVPGKKPLTEAQLRQRQQAARSPKPRRGRPPKSPPADAPMSESELARRIREPIVKIAEWLDTRNPELSRVLRDDAGKMSALLAKLATSSKAPAPAIAAVRLLAVLLEPIDAFGRVLRVSYVQLRERRARIRAEVETGPSAPEPEPGAEPAPEYVPDTTPARFRADAEPPPTD